MIVKTATLTGDAPNSEALIKYQVTDTRTYPAFFGGRIIEVNRPAEPLSIEARLERIEKHLQLGNH